MKKLLMSASLLAITTIAVNAQTGSILVGGNVDISSSKVSSTPDDYHQNSISFNPTIGYQFTNNLTAGVTGILTSNKNSQGNIAVKNSGFNAGPFIRYSTPLSNVFSVYGQLQATFGSGKTTNTNNSTTTTSNKVTTSNIGLFPAVFINLKNNFGLNFNIGGISYGSSKPSGQNSFNTFNLNFGRTGSIGISKNFGRGKK